MTGATPGPGIFPTLARLARYLLDRRIVVTTAVLLLLGGLVVQSVQPLLFGRAVNDIADGRTDGLTSQALVILLLAVVTFVLRWSAANLVAVAAQTAMHRLRREVFEKLQTLSLGFHDQRSVGELMSRVTSDTEVVNTFLSSSLFGLVSAVVQLVAVTVLMFTLDLTMTVLVLVLAPASILVMGRIGRGVAANYGIVQRTVGTINGYLEENVNGQKSLQAYGRQAESVDALRDLSLDARDADQRASFLGFTVMPMVRLVSNADVVLIALVGGIQVVRGEIDVGTVVAFLGYSQQFSMPIGAISRSINQAIQASAGATRVFELLGEEPEITNRPDASALDRVDGDVEFDEVDFSYVVGQQILFDNSFAAQAGQMIGLIGPTGAGKSTIINLIGRFYEIDDGEIRLDGSPIVGFRIEDLRRRAATVLQTPFLFSESVMYNLKYGRADATDAECIQAAKDANAHSFIDRLPDGYDTVLAESGVNLSQGQRQLLTIARAIVARPDVLILDEATSSVDTRTEQEIQLAMNRLMSGRTSFLIAHRLSTVRHADAIIALDHGRIVEMGTHEELLARRGFYYTLFMEQFARTNGRS